MTDDRSVKRDSPWTSFFFIIGGVFFIIGLLSIILSFFISEVSLIGSVITVGAALQTLFCGFVLQVFTDIRWYTQKCADQIEESSELTAHRTATIKNKLDELTEKAEKTNTYLYHIYNK